MNDDDVMLTITVEVSRSGIVRQKIEHHRDCARGVVDLLAAGALEEAARIILSGRPLHRRESSE